MPRRRATPSPSVLVYTPLWRSYARAAASRAALLEAAPCPVELVTDAEQVYPPPDQRNVLHAYERARERLLASDHTHLLCLEDDMVCPPDTAARLLAADTPVTYGLYTWRRQGHPWSAYRHVYVDSGVSWSEDSPWEAAKLLRLGGVVETKGLGMGCTLIARAVLQAIPFRLFNPTGQGPANDWSFAVDCQAAGVRQAHHFGVVCGHMLAEHETVWPDVDAMDRASYRIEVA